MSPTDAATFLAESERTPLHVGLVAVFDGPTPTYGELIRLVLARLSMIPRYRQTVRTVPLGLGRPVWVDDPHFQILYHVRHTALPGHGTEEQLRNLAGRVLGQRLDPAKPLWELWLVEGLENDRWALISKVHHCVVGGHADGSVGDVGGADLMQLVLDVRPEAGYLDPQDWTPRREPSVVALVADAIADTVSTTVHDTVLEPLRELTTGGIGRWTRSLLDAGQAVAETLAGPPPSGRPAAPGLLAGPIGPHRRWAWTQAELAELRAIRTGLGGTVHDVVLAAVTSGFRALLGSRGAVPRGATVRVLVPVTTRGDDGRTGIAALTVDLPVGTADPVARLAAVRRQMDAHKASTDLVDAPSIAAMGELVAPPLLSSGVRAAVRATRSSAQALTTNIPGPRVPLYVLGRRMTSAHVYVPLAGSARVSIGVFSYLGTTTFGVNADFDGFPDIEVITAGMRSGVDELLRAATGPSDG